MMTNIHVPVAGTCVHVHGEYRDQPPIIHLGPAKASRDEEKKEPRNPQQEKSMSFLPCQMAAVNTNIHVLYLRV